MRACDPRWLELLSAWFDGELTHPERARVLGHVRACAGCARELEGFGTLRSALRRPVLQRDPLPASGSPARRDAGRGRSASAWVASGVAAVVAGVVVLGAALSAGDGFRMGGREASFAQELERAHLRAFSRTSPCEFESSEPREVQEWVRREVGYEVPVAIVPGSTLLGARRHRVEGGVFAALLYRNGDRAMTLFFPPSGSSIAAQVSRFAGAQVRCTRGPLGETVCVAPLAGQDRSAVAVSEVDAGVLRDALARVGP